MSSQTLVEPHSEKLDSHHQFVQLYRSIAEVCKELVPLEKKVLKHEERLKEGKISPLEAQLLKKDMDHVLSLYDKLEKVSNELRELRRQLPPNERESEINAITETKTYLCIEGMRTHSKMMGSKTPSERVAHADIMEGLGLAEKIIADHIADMEKEFGKINRELSAHKLG